MDTIEKLKGSWNWLPVSFDVSKYVQKIIVRDLP